MRLKIAAQCHLGCGEIFQMHKRFRPIEQRISRSWRRGLHTRKQFCCLGVIPSPKFSNCVVELVVGLGKTAQYPTRTHNETQQEMRACAAYTHGFTAVDGVAGSSICKIWSAGTLERVWVMPLGQRTSIRYTTVFCPNPKCTRLSLAER